jgi:pyruvate kinase
MLGENKGINAPGVSLPASAITPKDLDDLAFGLSLGVDMIAVSFVQTPQDLLYAREAIAAANGAPEVPIVAKLERPRALDQLDAILAACDAVMVARGDLGLEMPLEQVPRAQKEITLGARRRGIPVILATQVLESMTAEPRPTRAEVSDAANAVADGMDAIMLSAETATGAFPARAVQTLDSIIREAEIGAWPRPSVVFDGSAAEGHNMALCEAAVTLAERSGARAIVAVTRGGVTARRLSTLRPHAPIVAATDRHETARRLAMHWGVMPICMDIGDDVDSAKTLIAEQLVQRRIVARGDAIVLVRINPDLGRQDANYLKIQKV